MSGCALLEPGLQVLDALLDRIDVPGGDAHRSFGRFGTGRINAVFTVFIRQPQGYAQIEPCYMLGKPRNAAPNMLERSAEEGASGRGPSEGVRTED